MNTDRLILYKVAKYNVHFCQNCGEDLSSSDSWTGVEEHDFDIDFDDDNSPYIRVLCTCGTPTNFIEVESWQTANKNLAERLLPIGYTNLKKIEEICSEHILDPTEVIHKVDGESEKVTIPYLEAYLTKYGTQR